MYENMLTKIKMFIIMQIYELSEKREYSSICQLWDDDDLRFGVEEEKNILVYDRIKCNKLH